MGLKDKVAIITGSSRGIGLEIAKKLAENGCKLVICSTKHDTATTTAESLSKEYSIEAIGVGVNVANEEDVQSLITQTVERFGAINILVNNAGITKDNLLLRLKSEDWTSVIETNLNSVFYCTKAVLKPMLKQKNGRIINVSSVVGLIGNPGQSNYAASKAGMIAFTKSVAKEYASKGIIANAIAPGFIETDMIATLPEEYLNNIISSIPLGRLGQSGEIANLVAFLASDVSGYMTGQTFKIDGGLSM